MDPSPIGFSLIITLKHLSNVMPFLLGMYSGNYV